MSKDTSPKDEEAMKRLVIDAIGLIGIGAALVAYAHANFASKSTVETLDQRIYDLWIQLPPEKRSASTEQ